MSNLFLSATELKDPEDLKEISALDPDSLKPEINLILSKDTGIDTARGFIPNHRFCIEIPPRKRLFTYHDRSKNAKAPIVQALVWYPWMYAVGVYKYERKAKYTRSVRAYQYSDWYRHSVSILQLAVSPTQIKAPATDPVYAGWFPNYYTHDGRLCFGKSTPALKTLSQKNAFNRQVVDLFCNTYNSDLNGNLLHNVTIDKILEGTGQAAKDLYSGRCDLYPTVLKNWSKLTKKAVLALPMAPMPYSAESLIKWSMIYPEGL